MTQDRLGLLALRKGELQHAISILEHALAQCRATDIPLYLPVIMATLGLAYAWSGQVTEALRLLDQVEVRQTTGGGGDRVMLHLGEAYLLAGRMEDAHRLAERALALSRDRKERGNQAWALRLLGEIAAQRQPADAAPAEAHYQQALALAEALGMRPLVAHCHLGLGKLYATIGHRAEARAALSAAIELYRAMDMTFWLPQAEAVLAQWHSKKGLDSAPGAGAYLFPQENLMAKIEMLTPAPEQALLILQDAMAWQQRLLLQSLARTQERVQALAAHLQVDPALLLAGAVPHPEDQDMDLLELEGALDLTPSARAASRAFACSRASRAAFKPTAG